jgi:hypothetical protein
LTAILELPIAAPINELTGFQMYPSKTYQHFPQIANASIQQNPKAATKQFLENLRRPRALVGLLPGRVLIKLVMVPSKTIIYLH